MNITGPLILVLLSTSLSLARASADPASGALPRSTPEAQGVASASILDFVETADREIDALHSLMLLRHGHVIAEGWWAPYDAQSPHELYSLSKSFTSTAVGLAIAEGHLSLDDSVLSCFPEDAPAEPSANLKAMRVRDLLCMSTGHETEVSSGATQVCARTFLAHPVPCKPGTRFLYNTPATFMLSAMVQRKTGQPVLDYLRPRLFEPLGISSPRWDTNFQGISLGGYGLSVRTEDIARFGQLYLQKGRWQGKQLLPAAWVDMATARQTSNGSNPASDWDQGYGFQFWRCRHGAYRGDGAFGQYCLVMPAQDAVLAVTSGLRDMQAVLNLVWDKLLPAMQDKPRPRDRATHRQLQARLAALQLRPIAGAKDSPLRSQVAGRKFVFPPNDQQLEAITLEPDASGTGAILGIQHHTTQQRVRCRYGSWEKGRFAFGPYPERPMAASGAWASDDTYLARLCFYETPFCVTLRLRFAANQLTLDSEFNVSFGPTQQGPWTGQSP